MVEKYRVLVVDDDEDVGECTTLVLEGRGFIVCAVTNIDAAQLLCANKDFEPDVVLSDYRLGGTKNGMDAISAVRQAAGWDVPALLVTGDTTINFATRREVASFEVLYKPADTCRLCERISLLASRGLAGRTEGG